MAIDPVFFLAKLMTLFCQSMFSASRNARSDRSAPEMPSQLIKRLTLGVLLALDDELVLLPSNGPFFSELDLVPPTLGEHWPRQPAHIEGKVVDAPQVDAGRDRAILQHSWFPENDQS